MHSPAFQFYVQDFLTGTMHLSAEEVGAYMLLLCHQWDKGSLPAGDKELLRIARTRQKVLDVVKGKFATGEDGLLRNTRLEKEREKQLSYRKMKSESGKKGNEIRWQTDRTATTNVSQSDKKNVADDRPSPSVSFSFSETHYVNKKTRVGNQEFDKSPSAMMWQLFAQGISELMMGPYRTLRLDDVMAEIERQCPSGTIFTNQQHLLNKFKSVATKMLRPIRETTDKTSQHDYSQYRRR
jgi:uncharacterized protein YdaU (DUF1376 family)